MKFIVCLSLVVILGLPIDIPLLPFFAAFVCLMFLTLTIVLAKAYQVTKIDVLRYLKYE